MTNSAQIKWRRRVELRQRNFERQEVYYATHVRPADHAHSAAPEGPKRDLALVWYDRAQATFDDLVDRTHQSLRLMMLTPAPDLEALWQKLEIAVDEDIHEYGAEAREFMTAMRNDAARLAGDRQ